MYIEHYGLQREPFHITPDPYFFYLSPSHKESYASLIYGLRNRKGFISLTGEVGLGKTTVIRTFLSKWSIRSKIKTVFVFNSNLSFKGLLLTIYSELGLDLPAAVDPESGKDKHSLSLEDQVYELVHKLHAVLVKEYENGYNVILVIDDAQNMPLPTLENLRMLSNLETSRDKLLQIFLIGQTELENILNKRELRQLKQRIAIRAVLHPLSREQTKDYIRFRLQKAGADKGQEKIFTRGALSRIYKYSRGIPRKINIICDNALINGFGYGKKKISSSIIREVQNDLQGRQRKKGFRFALAGGVLLALLTAGLWASPYRDQIAAGVQGLSFWDPSFLATDIQDTPAQNAQELKMPVAPFPKAGAENIQPEPEAVFQEKPELEYGHIALLARAQKHAENQGTAAEKKSHLPNFLVQDPENIALHQELSELIPVYSQLSQTRQEVLIRMARQTSIEGLLSFKRMLAALEREDYQEAARQMIYSRWARAVGEYSYDLAEAMRTDVLQERLGD